MAVHGRPPTPLCGGGEGRVCATAAGFGAGATGPPDAGSTTRSGSPKAPGRLVNLRSCSGGAATAATLIARPRRERRFCHDVCGDSAAATNRPPERVGASTASILQCRVLRMAP